MHRSRVAMSSTTSSCLSRCATASLCMDRITSLIPALVWRHRVATAREQSALKIDTRLGVARSQPRSLDLLLVGLVSAPVNEPESDVDGVGCAGKPLVLER